ncbi:MAG: hypothetical protein RLZZ584_3455 [Pseudomonadota bacterium]
MKLLPALHPDRCSSQEQVHPQPSWLGALRRELRRLARRPRELALATWLPLAAMLTLGTLVNELPPSELTLVVVDADDSAASRQLLRRLDAGPELHVLRAATPDEARAAVSRGQAQAALRVPEGFGAALAARARSAVLGAAATATAGAAPGASPPTVEPRPAADAPQVEIRLVPHNGAADARVLAHVRGVLDSLAAEADSRASAALALRQRDNRPGMTTPDGSSPSPGTGAATGPRGAARAARAAAPRAMPAAASPLAPPPLRLHLDAPALQARADAQVAGSAMLLLLLHLSAALLTASVVGREFTDRSASQWLAASGRRWRVALVAKLTPPAVISCLHALVALALWQWLAPAPLQGDLLLVAAGLLLSQLAGLGLGLLLCGLQPSLRSALTLLGLLAPLVLVLLQHAAAGAPWWAELLPVAHALRVVDQAWWLPASLEWDWPALRSLGMLAAQAAALVAAGGWLLTRRAFADRLAAPAARRA